MSFVHYSGAGNTFLLADNRNGWFAPEETSDLCGKNNVDGIIVAETSHKADARMRLFNRDGSEAEMCGNGLRCFIRFLKELGIQKPLYEVETLAGLQKGWIVEDEVCVQFAPPKDLRLHMPYDLHFINTGVPHAVHFVDDIENFDLPAIGRALRFSPLFAPAGANINFVLLNPDHSLMVRTYERGVEAETLACGTGAVAVALITHHLYKISSPVTLWVRSGERLTVSFNPEKNEVFLQGPAVRLGNLV